MASTIAAPPGVALTTSYQTIHTCTAAKRQIVEVVLVNVDGVNTATADVDMLDASAASAVNPMCKLADVVKKDVTVLPRRTLESGDQIRALASAVGDVFAYVNVVLEIDA